MIVLAFIFGVDITLFALIIFALYKGRQPKNKVHFYVARDKNGELFLYLGKPARKKNKFGIYRVVFGSYYFEEFGLHINDYKDLKWEDEPIEVFVNLKD